MKRIVRNPQPKLNPDRLQGPKGIPELLRISKNIKLKGRGHELQDVNLIMSTLKHWGHRLFPKIMSSDFFERVERLGSKKTIQSYVRRVRMGLENVDVRTMPQSSEFVESDDDNIERGLDDSHRGTVREDLFENLLDRHMNEINGQSASTSGSGLQTAKPTVVLNEDAKAKVERNKQSAIERRLKRLAERAKLCANSDAQDPSELNIVSSTIILQESSGGLNEFNSSEGNLYNDSNSNKGGLQESTAESTSRTNPRTEPSADYCDSDEQMPIQGDFETDITDPLVLRNGTESLLLGNATNAQANSNFVSK